MHMTERFFALVVSLGLGAASALAQTSPGSPSVDRVFRISGQLLPAPGAPSGGVDVLRVAIYDAPTGGTALWDEVQTLAIDADGRYTVLVGAVTADGVPVEVFASGAPRWLAVQRRGAPEAPRTLLTSVPYAVRSATAADADTLGGLPASAFLKAATAQADGRTGAAAADAPAVARSPSPLTVGTAGHIGKFTTTVDLGDSVMFENAGRIGIGTTAPFDTVHARFTDAGGAVTGFAVQNLSGAANAYSGMLFYDQNGALGQFQGFNNTTHEYRINNVASGGTINFMLGGASAFKVASGGNVGVSQGNPAYRLDVQSTGNPVARFSSSGSSAALRLQSNQFARLDFSLGDNPVWALTTSGLDNAGTANPLRFMRGHHTVGVNGEANVISFTGAGDIELSGDLVQGQGQDEGLRWVDGVGTLVANIYHSSTNRLVVSNSGVFNTTGVYVASGGTSWTSTSDVRLKTDIAPVTHILDKIAGIRVVGFNMFPTSTNAQGGTDVHRDITPRVTRDGRTIKHQIGSIAQDWIADFPELVVEPSNDDGYYGLDYDRVGVVALGAAQELHALLKEKDAEMRRKDAEIAALTERLARVEAVLKALAATAPR